MNIINKILGVLAGFVSIGFGLFLFGRSKEKQGEKKAANEMNETAIENIIKANENDEEIHSADRETLVDRGNKWSRD